MSTFENTWLLKRPHKRHKLHPLHDRARGFLGLDQWQGALTYDSLDESTTIQTCPRDELVLNFRLRSWSIDTPRCKPELIDGVFSDWKCLRPTVFDPNQKGSRTRQKVRIMFHLYPLITKIRSLFDWERSWSLNILDNDHTSGTHPHVSLVRRWDAEDGTWHCVHGVDNWHGGPTPLARVFMPHRIALSMNGTRNNTFLIYLTRVFKAEIERGRGVSNVIVLWMKRHNCRGNSMWLE